MAQHDTYSAAASADAGLLDLISRYRVVRDAKLGGWRTYCDETLPASVRNAARLVFLDRQDGYFALEGEIVETSARTPEGAMAKAVLAIEALDRKSPIPLAGLAYSALADLVPEEAIPGGPLYLRDGSAVAMRDGHKPKLEPITDPDAELRRACGVFRLVELEMARVDDPAGGLTDDEADAVTDAFQEALVTVSRLPARTASGLQVKAAVCRAVLKADEPKAMAGQFGGPARRHDVLAWSLLSDMAGVRPLAPVAIAPDPDAELLACCREAEVANQEAAAVVDRIEALDDDDATVMPALEAATPLFVAYSDAVLRAGQLPARTPEGLRAKATILLLHLTTDDDPVPLAASLARDLVGRAGLFNAFG